MQLWEKGDCFACVRDEAGLQKLPEAEQKAWRQLWADVAALRKRAALLMR
jgi:hypothetical protein